MESYGGLRRPSTRRHCGAIESSTAPQCGFTADGSGRAPSNLCSIWEACKRFAASKMLVELRAQSTCWRGVTSMDARKGMRKGLHKAKLGAIAQDVHKKRRLPLPTTAPRAPVKKKAGVQSRSLRRQSQRAESVLSTERPLAPAELGGGHVLEHGIGTVSETTGS